jgi:formylglycine-generating enzyme required for sulfatase activity
VRKDFGLFRDTIGGLTSRRIQRNFAAMRMTLAPALLVALTATLLAAPTNKLVAVGTNAPGGKKVPALVLTNSVVIVSNAPAVETNKVTIKDLILLPAFTNNAGMVMVKIASSTWAGKYEVTQEEYRKITAGSPSQFAGDRNPVDSVSWNEAMAFCAKLNDAESKEDMLPEGMGYTLPTQATWETMAASSGANLSATSDGKSRTGTAPVGSLGENALGLCDVRGNVWEWCLDPQDKPFRVLRGAAWDTSYEPQLRPEFRWYSNGPDDKKNNFGFRVILVAAPK